MAENQDFLNSPGIQVARESFKNSPKADPTLTDQLLGLDWSAIGQFFSTVATVVLAIVACKGFSLWKHQINTQIKIQFIDELINAIHDYISAMGTPVTMVSLFEIEIKAYSDAEALRGNAGENAGFIQLIESHGAEKGNKFFEHLEKARPAKVKVQSLMTKGQIFGLEEYNKAYDACNMLIWSHGLIEGLAAVLSGTNLNWEHPTVQENLTRYRTIRSSDIQKNLNENNEILLKFVKNIYEKLIS